MQASTQEKVFSLCGDLSWLNYFNQNLIETYIKRINKQISDNDLSEEKRDLIFLQVTNMINVLTSAGEEEFNLEEESMNVSEASETEEKKEEKKKDPVVKTERKSSLSLKQAKLEKKSKILSLSMRVREGKEKLKK